MTRCNLWDSVPLSDEYVFVTSGLAFYFYHLSCLPSTSFTLNVVDLCVTSASKHSSLLCCHQHWVAPFNNNLLMPSRLVFICFLALITSLCITHTIGWFMLLAWYGWSGLCTWSFFYFCLFNVMQLVMTVPQYLAVMAWLVPRIVGAVKHQASIIGHHMNRSSWPQTYLHIMMQWLWDCRRLGKGWLKLICA